jgi:hypothetical protein
MLSYARLLVLVLVTTRAIERPVHVAGDSLRRKHRSAVKILLVLDCDTSEVHG